MKTKAPNIVTRNIKGKHGIRTYHVVDFGEINGRRERKQFTTREDADKYARKATRDRKRFGDEAFKLTAEQRTDASEALAILGGKKYERAPNFPLKSLRAAALFYVQHTDPDGGKRTMGELLEELLDSRREKGIRTSTLNSYRQHIGHVARYFGTTPIGEITTKTIEAWFRTKNYGTETRLCYHRHLHLLFNFALKREYVHANPIKRIDKPRKDRTIVGYLTADQAESVLYAAFAHVPEIIPYLVLGMFGGLRPSEVHGHRTEHGPLDWSAIDLRRGSITVTPKQDKIRQGRHVEISSNLKSWLLPYVQKSGPVHYTRRGVKNAFKIAGVKYINDGLRHSFGTHHWAMHRKEGETAIQLGDTIATVKRHYVNTMAEKEDAERFWQIYPPVKEQVLRLGATA